MQNMNGQSLVGGGNLVMTKTDVAGLLGVSLRQVEILAKTGRIPQAFYLGPNSPRWRRPELLQSLGFPADVRTDSGLMQ